MSAEAIVGLVVGIPTVIVSVVAIYQSHLARKDAQEANEDAKKANERITGLEEPRVEFSVFYFSYHQGSAFFVECTVVNRSKLADAVVALDLDMPGFKPPDRRGTYVFNVPGISFPPTWTNYNTWPHALPVALPPLSVVTFRHFFYSQPGPPNGSQEAIAQTRIIGRLHTLRGTSALERVAAYKHEP